ncbi:MAG: MOSC domain-containing protein [Acetobacteraceae bacterium]|nr:MOSC domain-containing protein [Acetobacteraceae bacterium]
MLVEHLYRYPVKGLNAEALEEIEVSPGQALPWDRAFALAQGDSGFDPARPEFRHKSNFMCLLKNAGIARLRAAFDPHDRLLTIRAPDGEAVVASPMDPAGRAAICDFLCRFLGDEARGTPVFHHVPGHVFGDQRQPAVSLLSLPTLAQVERDIGAPRDPLRFRANIYIRGAAPWAEFDWIDRPLSIGTAVFRAYKRTKRCNATQVNPATAERDADPVRELMHTYGHPDLGIHLEVLEPGHLAVGDAVTLL